VRIEVGSYLRAVDSFFVVESPRPKTVSIPLSVIPLFLRRFEIIPPFWIRPRVVDEEKSGTIGSLVKLWIQERIERRSMSWPLAVFEDYQTDISPERSLDCESVCSEGFRAG
jgi:hypothetical protein